MPSDYTFLTDHSYSIRVDGNDKLSLKQRELKNKKRRGPSNRSNKTTSVIIHRSSSDKENNLSSPMDVSVVPSNPPETENKSSTKKKTTKSRTPSGKKQNNKNLSKPVVKSTQGKLVKKNKSIMKSFSIDTSSIPASLSIEERVKLRRTKPFLSPIKPILNKKLSSNVQKSIRHIHFSKAKPTIIKPKKFFLGSGLDLDNIVPGNRQRRSAQT